jgi:TolB-like protein/Tfp pilus assembly protein PilF
MSSAPGSVPLPAVFLSYAREDASAARRMAEALRAAGVEVWFDENELRGGDAWDKAIRKQIRDCTLFLPIISATTQARHEGYFRLEWHLAEQRSLLISKGRPFLVPVCIDDTLERDADVPEAFLAVQWMRLRDGEDAGACVARVRKLLAGGESPRTTPPPGSSSSARKSRPTAEDGTPDIPDYEMLRRIGRGSYGDVWLARGITGIYRAIKVVWRDRFADAAPFEREFKGLKEFAAISLGESIQLALLHIGRSDEGGYFYYVMELADDADRGRDIVPASYVPLTLTEARKRRGRLPAAECVGIGVELGRVLAGLHQRGLIHRDIKPSNIIFVGGVAKLADIGLVTPAGDASTFVGTEGFVPPEGPGSASADVFALGKLLYELSTGHDRQEFPKLPAEVRRLPDREALFELNEIIVRACERDAAKRYADGAAFLADLLAVQAGSSMRARRVGKNLLRWAAMAAILVGGGVVAWKWRPNFAATPEASPPPPVAAAASGKSIAVLPFINLTGDEAQEYFPLGITQEILGALRRERDLTVPGDTSCFAFKGKSGTAAEIGKALNVARLVKGSVRKAGNQVRISVTLTRVADGFSEELGTFTEEHSNIFALQEKLARAVVAKLTNRPPAVSYVVGTRNAEAYDLYLRARAIQTGGLTPTAGVDMIRTFEKVVELDPNYALAWARLSQAYSRMRSGGRDRSAKNATDAKNAATTALKLAPNLAEAHLAMANIHFHYERDLDATERELNEMDRLGPNDAEALALRASVAHARGSRGEEMIQLIARSAERDPQNSDTLVRLAGMLGSIGRFAEADRLFERARSVADIGIYRRPQAMNWVKWTGDAVAAGKFLDETPEGSFDAVLLGLDRAKMRVLTGDFAGAIADYERLRPIEAARNNAAVPARKFDELTARAEARLGRPERLHAFWGQSLAALQGRAKDDPDAAGLAGGLAFAHAMLGEKAAARTWLAKWLDTPAQNETNRQLEKAELLALLGDTSAAVAELRALHEAGHPFGFLLRLELEWEPLRADPKFQQLMKDAEARAHAQPRPPAGLAEAEKRRPAPKASQAARAPDPKSVAVLAFKNVGGDPANAALVDGIGLELISVLGRVPTLTVRGNSSLGYFQGSEETAQEKGRKLDVTYLVEGSLQRAGDTVRIVANLTRAATNEIVWSSPPLTRDVRNIFAVQEEIAGLIAQTLSLKLGASSGAATAAVHPQALEFYLQARQAWNLRTTEGFARAEDLLNRAIGLDRNLARAHAALADVWLQRDSSNARVVAFSQRDSPAQARIVAKVREALALDPLSAEAHASLGHARWHGWQMEAAVQHLRQALTLNPNYANAHHWLGRALAVDGRMDEAIAELQRAAELDPFAPTILDNYAWFLTFAGRYREAEPIIARIELLQPNLAQTTRRRVGLLLTQGRNTAAMAEARAITPTNQTGVISKIFALADAGLKAEAEALLPELTEESWRPNALAAVGRYEESIAAFTEARLTMLSLNLFFYERACDPIRDDPRLRRLLAVVGATESHARAQAWRAAHPAEKVEARP